MLEKYIKIQFEFAHLFFLYLYNILNYFLQFPSFIISNHLFYHYLSIHFYNLNILSIHCNQYILFIIFIKFFIYILYNILCYIIIDCFFQNSIYNIFHWPINNNNFLYQISYIFKN